MIRCGSWATGSLFPRLPFINGKWDAENRLIEIGYAGMYYHGPSGLYLTKYRAYDPRDGRWLSRDPIGESGGINLYTYVEGNPITKTDPLGLATYICTRPLGGKPGTWTPPVFNHTYVCVGDSLEGMNCGSSTASSGGFLKNTIGGGSPGAPTTPKDDYYNPKSCDKRWDKDSCIETCIANELKNPNRPWYAVGPMGTDCQEHTWDIVHKYEKRCARR